MMQVAQQRDQAARPYIQDVAGVSTAEAKLGQDGVLSEEAHSAAQKARILA